MKGNMKRFLAVFLSSLMVLGMASGVYADTPETQSQTENSPQEGTESQGNGSLTPKPGSSESQKTTETEESGKQSPQTQNPEKDTDTGSADSKKTTQGKTTIAPSVSGTPEASKVPEGSDDTDTSGKDSGKAQSGEKNSLEPDGREDSGNPAISGSETEETQAERKFEIQNTELKKDQEQLIVTVYTENNDYDRIYIGSREDTDKTPVIEGIKQVMGGYSFRFQVEEEKLGQRLTVVPGVTEEDSWYTDKDVYCDIPELEEEQGFLEFSAVDSLQDQAVMSISEGTDNSGNAEIIAQKPDGTTFPMFNIEKSTAQVNGDQIDIVLYLKANASGKFTYSEIYLGSKEDEEKTPTIKGNVNEGNQQVYSFSVPLSVQGTNVKFVPIKADGSYYKTADLFLTIPSFENTPTPTPSDTPTPTPSGTPEQNTGVQVIKEADGTAFKMFVISESTAAVNGDKIEIAISTNNTSYDRLYLGSKDDAVKEPVVQGTEKSGGGWSFSFEVPLEKKGTSIPVTLGYPDGTWYVKQNLLLTIPDVKADEPDIELPEAEVKVEQGGTGAVLNSFIVTSSSAKLSGDSLSVTITVGNTIYDRIYLGNKVDSNKEPVFNGTSDGTNTTFTFTVPADKQGLNIPITLGNTGGAWLTSGRQLFIAIPNLNRTFDLDSFTDGTYDLYGNAHTDNQMLNIESGSQIVVKGDEAVVTIITNSTSDDKIYIGSVSDSEEMKDANAIEGVLLGDSDPERKEYRNFTFTVPKSAIGGQVYFVRHNIRNGWVSKQDVLELPQFLVKTGEAEPEDTEYYKVDLTTDADKSAFAINAGKSYVHIMDALCQVVVATDSDGYNRMYLGTREELQDSFDSAQYLSLWNLDGGGYAFVISGFTSELMGTSVPYVLYSTKTGKWTEGTYYLNIPGLSDIKEECMSPAALKNQVDDSSDPYKDASAPGKEEDTPTPEPSGTPADGIYSTTADTGQAMFKVVNTELTVKDGKMSARITLSGAGYDYLYMGTGAEADADAGKASWVKWEDEVPYISDEGVEKTGRRYTIPVAALDTPLAVASHSESHNKWYDRQITFSSENLVKTGDLPGENTPSDGIYSTTAETGVAMFKVVNAELTVKEGKMTARITLSGQGYDYLYMGTGAEADADAGKASWIKWEDEVTYTSDEGVEKTGRRYTIPVPMLDAPIAVASHSESHNKWYDRQITFSSENLVKTGDLPGGDDKPVVTPEPKPTQQPTPQPTAAPKPDSKPDNESKYEDDLSGATGTVNSSTSLPDGVYTPDKFSWSGGTGRVSISCSKITIQNGQALAAIVFSSSSYAYIKANGRLYYGSSSGGKSTFVIPVALNKNNTIIGMTTKMSAAHEITYSIYIYLAAAAKADGTGGDLNFGTNEKLDEVAPDIIGLEFQSETKLDYAEYFKIYHYDQGITLLEIDMTKDTARDPDKLKEEAGTSGDTGAENTVSPDAAISEEEGGEAIVQTSEEITADLYKANVVKYLIIPDDGDVEVPVGLEKEMIIVKLPVEKSYFASEEALKTMDELDLLSMIQVVGYEEEETQIDGVKEALADKDMVFAGAFDDPEFKELVRGKCDLAVLSSEILPNDDDGENQTDSETKKGQTSEEKSESQTSDKKAKGGTVGADEKKLTAEEQTERMEEITDRFAALGIPAIVDRSADEESELAQYEWIKVYGVLFGCTDKTDKLFDAAVAAAKK